MATFCKLWSGITESSLWGGSKEARLLFVTLLAKADSTGFVEAAPSGLARLANLTRSEIDTALKELTSPDPESKSKVAEGKRVAFVEGGVCVVNYEEYRKRRDDEERREYMREYMRLYRSGLTDVNSSKHGKPPLAQGELEGELELEGEKDKRVCMEGDKPPSMPPSPLEGGKVRRRSRKEIIQAFSDEVRLIVNTLGAIWPSRGTNDEPTSPTDIALFAQRVSEIIEKGTDPAILLEAGRQYCTTPRPKFSAPQFFFGTTAYGGKGEAPWVGYVKLILTKKEAV